MIVKVLRAMLNDGKTQRAILGSPKEVILNSHCSIHQEAIRSGLAIHNSKITKNIEYFNCSFIRRKSLRISANWKSSGANDSRAQYHRELDLVPVLGPSKTQLTGKSLHPQWIEHGLLSRWRLTCDLNLKDDCRQVFTKTRLVGTRPTWLVDTWTLCLVSGNRDDSYVALSYVWGPADFFQTLRSNLDMLQARHALSNSELEIPQTIVDAFTVTQLLGQRYLWVDALCIVQDDHIMKQAQIQNMSYIYSQATIAIIAKQGNTARYGLRGFPKTSQPRATSQDIFRFGRKYAVIKPARERWRGEEYHNRGWTYQEEAFSRRRLIFSDDRVWWKCYCSSFQEDLHVQYGRGTDSGARLRRITNRRFNSDIPHFVDYQKQIGEFNTRHFTNPKNVVPAFAGITTVLTHSFRGGFLYGLPVIFFDRGLCWQPGHTPTMPSAKFQRRKPRGSLTGATNPLPSWSWMGWVTNVDYRSYFFDHVRREPTGYLEHKIAGDNVISTVQWYSKAQDSPELHPIEGPQILQAIIAEGNKRDATLPIGWHRVEYKNRTQPHIEHNRPLGFIPPRFVYRHDSEPNTDFYFPVPTAQDTPSPPAPLFDNLLCCKTQKTTFYIGKQHVDESKFRIYHALVDQQQQWSGILQLHSSDQLLPDNDFSSNPCELVVISEGYMIEGSSGIYVIVEWEFEERPKGAIGTKYEFFNVLWVEWEDGIAYRKGYGRVMKSAWEAQGPEMIDLTLG